MTDIAYKYNEQPSRIRPGETNSWFDCTHKKTGIVVQVFCTWPPSKVVKNAKRLIDQELIRSDK